MLLLGQHKFLISLHSLAIIFSSTYFDDFFALTLSSSTHVIGLHSDP